MRVGSEGLFIRIIAYYHTNLSEERQVNHDNAGSNGSLAIEELTGVLLRLLTNVGIYARIHVSLPAYIHHINTVLTLHGCFVSGVDARLVFVLLVALARLLGLGGLLQFVDGFTRMVLRLLGHVGVVDGGL